MLNQGWIYRDRVKPTQAGLTVLDFYTGYYRHSSRSDWQYRLVSEQIFLDGQPAIAGDRLQTNQKLEYYRPPWAEPSVPLDFKVQHRDEHFWIIEKPAGLPVMPAGNFLEHTLLHQLKRRFPKESLAPIHRLGRGTSGLMILGRSPLGRQQLSRQLREKHIVKIYQAIIAPGRYPDHVMITTPIGKVPHPTIDQVFAANPDGMPAKSKLRVLQRRKHDCLVQVQIFTGRPHQIRIHTAAMGFPLIGDRLYKPGGDLRIPTDPSQTALPGDCGYWLHAHHLTFTHPSGGHPVSYFCERNLPADARE